MDLDHVELSTFPNRTHKFFETFMRNLTELTEPYRVPSEGPTRYPTANQLENEDFVRIELGPGKYGPVTM